MAKKRPTYLQKLQKQLEGFGVKAPAPAAEFFEWLRDNLASMYPGYNSEQLMYEPSKATAFCEAVRQRWGKDIPDKLIIMCICYQRKKPH